ncbi:MAG: hypothetical protein AAF191_17990 [Verrucomicrobiota bacterium]
MDLCRELNRLQCLYLVVGGFAIRFHGYDRSTMDVDLLLATDPDNEARVLQALLPLPDQALIQAQQQSEDGE